MSESMTFVGRELSRVQDRISNLDATVDDLVDDHELARR